ncbi:dTMP kinase [uncultured Sphingomonas sp.]|uniref:dTMP kinase n=1 Tax=uncultured Sphingomonas sp. TaxID=158754 RepID=UPI0035CC6284
MRGRFVTLEGGEGAGKSTQSHLLATALEARGLRVVLTREPGGSEGAEAVRTLLMHGDQGRWSARAETLLFAAARTDHVEKLIEPALAAGAWVVCDRFVDSTRAYQGASGIDDADILALHAFGSHGLLPDRTMLLALSPKCGLERATERDGADADRFVARDAAFHDRVATAFDAIAAREPARVRRIPAGGGPGQVASAIWTELRDLLP